jgi:hypothetical protein
MTPTERGECEASIKVAREAFNQRWSEGMRNGQTLVDFLDEVLDVTRRDPIRGWVVDYELARIRRDERKARRECLYRARELGRPLTVADF